MLTNSSVGTGSTPVGKARLLAIVAVEPQRRVQCGNPGCGHGVYAAIHIVEDSGELIVMGSTCFAKRYGSSNALGLPAYSVGAGNGRMLTDDERAKLVNNTAALLESFRIQHEKVMNEANDRLSAIQQRMGARRQLTLAHHPVRPPAPKHPWPWQHPQSSSIAVLQAPHGQIWIRVQHRNGSQKLVPWPAFEGWETAIPSVCGTPDEEIQALTIPNIVFALKALQDIGYSAPVVTRWPEFLRRWP